MLAEILLYRTRDGGHAARVTESGRAPYKINVTGVIALVRGLEDRDIAELHRLLVEELGEDAGLIEERGFAWALAEVLAELRTLRALSETQAAEVAALQERLKCEPKDEPKPADGPVRYVAWTDNNGTWHAVHCGHSLVVWKGFTMWHVNAPGSDVPPTFDHRDAAMAWAEAWAEAHPKLKDEPKPRAKWVNDARQTFPGVAANYCGANLAVWTDGVAWFWCSENNGSGTAPTQHAAQHAAEAWAEENPKAAPLARAPRGRCVGSVEALAANPTPAWTWTQRGGRSYGVCGTVNATVWPDILPVAELYDVAGVTLATSTEAELPPYSTTDAAGRAWCERTAREKGWTR